MAIVEKKELYKRIKVYSLLSYIPVILAVGPLSGYALGSFLRTRFSLPEYVPLVFAGLGLLAAATEIARIVKLVSKTDKDG